MRRVVLCKLSSKFIIWLKNNKIQDIVSGFYDLSDFPNTIGAVDGSHINIPALMINPEVYVNRKGYHSIHLQVMF